MTLPNFFIIGPARCATDALYAYLGQHPEVYMSPIKETNWFVFEGREIEYCGPGDRAALSTCYVPSYQAYLQQFDGVRDETAVGEASPWYIYCPEVPSKIKRAIPDARCIAMLRNPIDRAYSSFGLMHRELREPARDFADALAQEDTRVASNWEPIWHYRRMGMYYEQVKRYRDFFSADQLRFYIYDDFEERPGEIMRDMFSFLGVDDGFVPDMSDRPNQSYIPKHDGLYSLVSKPNLLKRSFKPLLPSALRRRLRGRVMESNVRRSGPVPEVRHSLLNEFRQDIEQLEEILGRDLSTWR